jgi:hypothetical protein
MSDESKGSISAERTAAGTENQLTAEDRYVKDIFWQRKVVMDALRSGDLACLPNEKGYADTSPAVNLINNTTYSGSTLLYLKETQKQRGFPTAEYISQEQIEKAGESQGKTVFIEKGQRGISIPYKEQDKETGDWIPKHKTLFNIAQITNPEVVRAYAGEVQQKKEEERKAWAEQNGKTLRAPWHENEIQCTSSDPEKYLGQYITAVSFGARFKATQEQAAEFKDKTEKMIFEPSQTGKPNPMNILKLSGKANEYAGEFKSQLINERITEAHERQQPEKEVPAKQQQGRQDEGMGY